jgi:hypothetical protein
VPVGRPLHRHGVPEPQGIHSCIPSPSADDVQPDSQRGVVDRLTAGVAALRLASPSTLLRLLARSRRRSTQAGRRATRSTRWSCCNCKEKRGVSSYLVLCQWLRVRVGYTSAADESSCCQCRRRTRRTRRWSIARTRRKWRRGRRCGLPLAGRLFKLLVLCQCPRPSGRRHGTRASNTPPLER